jgi:uncharacterized protein (DUF2062 family)
LSRRIRTWLEKNLISRDRLRGERIHQIFGERLFASEVWHIDRHTISGGLALGLFVAFTPTIPFQMTIAALCAIWLRVNLPAALAACWVSNPLTIIPFYKTAYQLGLWSLGSLPGLFSSLVSEDRSGIRDLFSKAAYLWTGGVLMGSIAALSGYAFVRIVWYYASREEKK